MFNFRNIPIEPVVKDLSQTGVTPVKNVGEIPSHLPKDGEKPYHGKPKISIPPKARVSYPPTLGGIVDFDA